MSESTESLFIEASRGCYRFPSTKGDLTVEQLWQLHLSATSNFDLDNVAKELSKQIKALTGESFVQPNQNAKACAVLEKQLAIVVFVIKTKQEEVKAATERKARADKRTKLRKVLMDKQDQALSASSIEELERQLAELEAV